MAKNSQGFVGTILLLFRLLMTTLFTVAVFGLLLGFLAFRCMHTTGSHMLAAMLSSYPVVNVIPKIYYAPSTLEKIIAEQEKNQPLSENTETDDSLLLTEGSKDDAANP